MRRFDNETMDDLTPWLQAVARAWCEDENAHKTMDPKLAEAAAIHTLREHRTRIAELERENAAPAEPELPDSWREWIGRGTATYPKFRWVMEWERLIRRGMEADQAEREGRR